MSSKIIQFGNKMQEWQQAKNYNYHVKRMREISSPIQRRRSQKQLKKAESSIPDMSFFRNCHKAEQKRALNLENYRLLRKLGEIGRRKSQFTLISKDEENYYTISMKSKEANRKIKFEEIQHQNDLIVERIMKKRNGNYKGLFRDESNSSLKKKSLKKSRNRARNSSVVLPKIEGSEYHIVVSQIQKIVEN